MTTKIVRCGLCFEDVEADEYGIFPDHLKECKGRQSAHHMKLPMPKSSHFKKGST